MIIRNAKSGLNQSEGDDFELLLKNATMLKYTSEEKYNN